MSILKCKMCGGNLQVEEGQTICECEYCGTKQTVPKVDDEKKLNLYNRANRLRSTNEFDKAYGVFEALVADFPEEAEAYWGLCLCKYGIEYVDDHTTGRKIPTCHRTSYDSIFDDNNFEMALEYADGAAKGIYIEEAKEIDRLQKTILKIAKNEKPFDIFICYKETDEYGDRTIDSVIAQDVYTALTEKGYKVFFSRITLEDKLGQEYEPYIFAALNSAKVMLAFGTKYEYYNAVWVKNEWSRYLDLMKKDKSKVLIPCYKGIDAYDIPKEFAHLQAQDMGKVGALQDLLRGIEKIIPIKDENNVSVTVSQESKNVDSLLKRVSIFLEDDDYTSAERYCDRILDIDPENEKAYLGKLLVKTKLKKVDFLFDYYKQLYNYYGTERLYATSADNMHVDEMVKKYVVPNYLDESEIRAKYDYDLGYDSVLSSKKKGKEQLITTWNNDKTFSRVKQYASKDTKNKINDVLNTYQIRISEAETEDAEQVQKIKAGYNTFLHETDQLVNELYNTAIEKRENDYNRFVNSISDCRTIKDYESTITSLTHLNGYKDSQSYIDQCEREISYIQEEQRIQHEMEEQRRREDDYNRFISSISDCKTINDYELLIYSFTLLNGYKDSQSYIDQCKREIANIQEEQRIELEKKKREEYEHLLSTFSVCKSIDDYNACAELFKQMAGYEKADEYVQKCKENINRINAKKSRIRIISVFAVCLIICICLYGFQLMVQKSQEAKYGIDNITISSVTKENNSYNVNNNSFNYTINITVLNNNTEDIDGIKGQLIIENYSGEELYKGDVELSGLVSGGSSNKWSLLIKNYSGNKAGELWKSTNYNLTIKFTTKYVHFKDGTSKDITDNTVIVVKKADFKYDPSSKVSPKKYDGVASHLGENGSWWIKDIYLQNQKLYISIYVNFGDEEIEWILRNDSTVQNKGYLDAHGDDLYDLNGYFEYSQNGDVSRNEQLINICINLGDWEYLSFEKIDLYLHCLINGYEYIRDDQYLTNDSYSYTGTTDYAGIGFELTLQW